MKTNNAPVLIGRTRTPIDLSDVAFMEPEEPEWSRAWEARRQLTGDEDVDAKDPKSREVWKYLETVLEDGEWRHCFLHRRHPVTRGRLSASVPASAEWVDELRRRGRIRRLRRGA